MATSSIFTNIIIDDAQKAKEFINALDASVCEPEWKPTTPVKSPLSDAQAIRMLMTKRNKKK